MVVWATFQVNHLAGVRVAETAESAAGFAQPDGSPERIDEAVAAMWARCQEPYLRAATELWVAALHNPGLRPSGSAGFSVGVHRNPTVIGEVTSDGLPPSASAARARSSAGG